jgi:hypothetical protein
VGQLGEPCFEFFHTPEEFPTAGTRGLVHPAMVRTGMAISGASRTTAGSEPEGALNKYLPETGVGVVGPGRTAPTASSQYRNVRASSQPDTLLAPHQSRAGRT